MTMCVTNNLYIKYCCRGQTLEQIEKFDDPRSDDEEDEDGRKFGGLGGK